MSLIGPENDRRIKEGWEAALRTEALARQQLATLIEIRDALRQLVLQGDKN